MTKQCVQCKLDFEAKVGNQKCCSPDCFSAYRKEYGKKNRESRVVERMCKQCNEPYTRVYEKSGFCSISCGSKWNLEHGVFETWRTKVPARQGLQLPCAECSILRYLPPRFKEGDRIFCNRKCKGKYFGKLYAGTGNPMFGHKLTVEQKAKQRASLLANHGVTNAWTLAKHRTTSKAHQKIFEVLSSSFPGQLFETERVFRSGSHEYYLDIVSEPLKMVVEYNGDYWHCNPQKYSSDFFHQVKRMRAADIWASDEKRVNTLQKAGYSTFIVWEQDFHLNPSGSIEKLKDEVKKRCVSG